MRRLMCMVAVLLAFAGQAIAGEADLPVLKTKVRTLAAFKNGLGFLYRKGETPLKDGWAEMGEVPAAAMGAYWVGTSSPKNPIEEVRSIRKKVSKDVDPMNLSDILFANLGKEVTLTYNDGKGVVREKVTILGLPGDRSSAPALPSSAFGYGSMAAPRGYVPSDLVYLRRQSEAGSSTLIISRGNVLSIELPDGAPINRTREFEENGAKVHIKGSPAKAEVTVAYLQKGFNWAPSYMLDLLSEKEAQVTMEAVLANDVEDLDDVDVSFVVGYPSFMFADQMTLLALGQTVSSFIGGLTNRPYGGSSPGGVMSQAMSNVASQYGGSGYGERDWRPSEAYSATTSIAGESNEDLYFYRQEHVTLGKGERARFTVLTGKVPIEHIYTLDVPDKMNVDAWGNRSGSDGSRSPADQVWHALRIDNTTKQPWTTAPALVVNGSLPLSQGMMEYTSPSAKTTLKLTVATDLQTSMEQTELERKEVTANRYNCDAITVGGKVTVKNWKAKPVKMNVKKRLLGEVLAAEGSKVRKTATELNAVNPNSLVEWEFDLKPGESKDLEYKYKVLFRR